MREPLIGLPTEFSASPTRWTTYSGMAALTLRRCLGAAKESDQIRAAATILATAIKAFPFAAIAYLLWRRQWQAAAATLVWLFVILVLLPSPFRGYERSVHDLDLWYRHMLADQSGNSVGGRDLHPEGVPGGSLLQVEAQGKRHAPAVRAASYDAARCEVQRPQPAGETQRLAGRAALVWALTEEDAGAVRSLGAERVEVLEVPGRPPRAQAAARSGVRLIGNWTWGPNAAGLRPEAPSWGWMTGSECVITERPS